MKIGLYFGSFNPVHTGHLVIANHILNHTPLEKLWFVVSPHNPFKKSDSLLNEYDRLHLLKIATAEDPRIKVLDIEFNLPKPSYSSVTLAFLREKHPEHEFVIIMGSDSFQNLPKWKNAEVIMRDYEIYVYKRPGFEPGSIAGARARILDAPLIEISSTEIRQLIKQNLSFRYLVPDSVREEIERSGYYRR